MKLGLWLLIVSTLAAGVAFAQSVGVGDRIAPLSLEDQHGVLRAVDEASRVVLFSRDMDGGKLLKQALADTEAGFLESRQAVYVADISGMPKMVARLFALPSMRRRPYPMLLDRTGEATRALPDVEEKATLIFLDALEVERIEHLDSSEAVRAALGD